jgi:5'(3')-deoxyribonucleotidase
MNIDIYKIPLGIPIDDVRRGLIKDERLEANIIQFADELKEEDVETWIYEKNMIVTENGYYVSVYREEISNDTKYIELCERTIKHLIGIIQVKQLQSHFNPEVLKDAYTIKNIHTNKK